MALAAGNQPEDEALEAEEVRTKSPQITVTSRRNRAICL